jgi:hypothetical protein
MTTEGLIAFQRQNPFRPFAIHTSSGQSFHITNQYQMVVSSAVTVLSIPSEVSGEPKIVMIDNYQISHVEHMTSVSATSA